MNPKTCSALPDPTLRQTIIMAIFAAMLIMTAAGFSGCGTSAFIDDSGDPGIIGVITSVDVSSDGGDRIATILIEGTPEENAGLISDKASVSITKETVLVNGTEKKYFEEEDASILVAGTAVEIVFTGPVAESYPVQGSAKVVRIK